MTADRLLVAQWGLSSRYGWGVYGLNLALTWPQLDSRPLLFSGPLDPDGLDAGRAARLEPLLAASRRLHDRLRPMAGASVTLPAVVLHALGNGMAVNILSAGGTMVTGQPSIGVVFFEDTAIDDAARARLAPYPLIVAGSAWNREVLAAAGVGPVALVLQGVDTGLFRPPPEPRRRGDRFLVFSGGKLEYRKGQDIVLRAFRAFHARHPEAVLVTAWQSPWPELAQGLSAAAGLAPPPVGAGGIDVVGWAVANGLPAGAVVDLGAVPNGVLPALLHGMDAALFANRAEGGTNLAAMEAMACAVPTILSANTGHLDLIRPDNCLALTRQRPVTGPVAGMAGTAGWGDSDVEEAVAALETLWRDPDGAAQLGLAAARDLAALSWPAQVGRFRQAIEPVLT